MKRRDPHLTIRQMLDHAREAPDIIGLRNRLIHGYDAVDYEIVWRVVQEDLEPLIRKLEQME